MLWETDKGHPVGTLVGHLDWVSAVAFGPDPEATASASNDKIVASASNDKTARLWRSEKCIMVIEITQPPKVLSFSEDGKDLNIGRRWVDVKSGALSTRKDLTQSVCRTSLVEDWITRDGEKILWLPPDYRPTCFAFHGDRAVLGHESGRLTFLEFMSG
jgi:WD40 repeat protein